MIKILIAVPSHKRAYSINKSILFWLRDFGYDYKFFLDKSEALHYSTVLRKDEIVLVKDKSYLCGKLNSVGLYAKKHGYNVVLKLDDEMHFKKIGSKKGDVKETVLSVIKDVIKEFESDKDLGLVNVVKFNAYLRNKEGPKFRIRKKEIFGNYFVVPDLLLRLKQEWKIFDDLLISVNAKLNNYVIKCYYGAYECALTHTNKGGIQSFDRDLLSKNAYEEIKKDFPLVNLTHDKRHNKLDLDVSSYFGG